MQGNEHVVNFTTEKLSAKQHSIVQQAVIHRL